MKAFIDRVFKKRKQDAEQVEKQIIEQPIAQIESVEEQATQAAVESISKEIEQKEFPNFIDINKKD